MRSVRHPSRPGTVLPMIGCCLIALFTFVALAVDLGMLAVNRTQCQNAADVAALVGCRNLDNKDPDNPAYDSNKTAAVSAADAALTTSPLMSGTVANGPSLVKTVETGMYVYRTDVTPNRFEARFDTQPAAGQSWTAVRVTASVNQPTYFMKLWGVSSMPSGARAVAVHRPRDVAFVLDMTGSMAYGSTMNYSGKSLNPDNLAPAFGHYVSTQSNLIATANETNSSGEAISRNNFTITTPGGPPIVRDFYFDPANVANPTNAAYPLTSQASLKKAFHRWSPPESGGNADTYTPPTYNFSGYNAYHTGNEATPKGPTPAPDNFKTMTDSGSITYVGDRWRRADGSINKTNTSWATNSSATKAATDAIELLGYNMNGTNVRKGTSGSTVITTEDKFRDPVWEAYGYDLDIVKYRAWKTASNSDLPASTSAYLSAKGASTSDPTNVLVPAADRFQGFSMGPGYWGKTFFVWPPDPRDPVGNPGAAGYVPGDWRERYFLTAAGAAFNPQNDNNPATTASTEVDSTNEVLLNTGGGLTLAQSSSSSSFRFQVNYTAVLKWIKSGPQVLPPNLRAGRVLYYSSIPDDVNTGTGSTQQKLDKAFWKNYIDYVLGANVYSYYAYLYTSYGVGFTQLYGFSDSWSSDSRSIYTANTNTWTGPSSNWTAARPYMRYTDSPNRPRLHFWFGPLSMMDFIASGSLKGNMNPGTVHEAQCWQLKAGMNSVLDDIRNNHPNDSVGMVMFSYGSDTPNYGAIRVAQGQDFVALKNALFYPKSLLSTVNGGDQTTEKRPYDASWNGVGAGEIPNANGSTDPNSGLMLAFNLLSPSANLPTEYGSVRGRRGASKVVIFETDGVPNSYSNFTLNKMGYNSYYSAVTGGNGGNNGDQTAQDRAVAVAAQMVKTMATGTSGDSGLSLGNAPAKVYPIGFGDLFDSGLAPSATFRSTAHQFLSNVGIAGGTLPAGTTTLPSSQVITGSYQNRIDTLRNCLERIFQSGVSVALIE